MPTPFLQKNKALRRILHTKLFLVSIILLALGVYPATVVHASENRQEPPVVVSQVEFNGPGFMVGDDFGPSFLTPDPSCPGPITGIGPVWIELNNTLDKKVDLYNYSLIISESGYSERFAPKLSLDENQNCIIMIGPPQLSTLPSERSNLAVTFSYEYEGKEYEITTPPLTDTFGDIRTWQLVNGTQWVFREGTVPDVKRITVTSTTQDGSILVNLTRAEQLRNGTTTAFKIDFLNSETNEILADVDYEFLSIGAGNDDANSTSDFRQVAKGGSDFRLLDIPGYGSMTIRINIFSVGEIQFDEPKTVEFATVVVPEFPIVQLIAASSIAGLIATFSVRTQLSRRNMNSNTFQ